MNSITKILNGCVIEENFSGTFENSNISLSREIITKENKMILQRTIFYNITENELDWI